MRQPTVRISESTRCEVRDSIYNYLNNIVGFVECPIQDKGLVIDLWHGKLPPDYVSACETVASYVGTGGGAITLALQIGVEIDGRRYRVTIRPDELPAGTSTAKIIQNCLEVPAPLVEQIKRPFTYKGELTSYNNRLVPMEAEYIRSHLGDALTEDFFVWVINSAKLYDDIILSAKALKAILGMAKSAGQIKRMVPDLLQYLPEHIQRAFAEQKRSSTLPFEWATFPKNDVEIMIATINKGHLLANMKKPAQHNWKWSTLDQHTWSRHATWTD